MARHARFAATLAMATVCGCQEKRELPTDPAARGRAVFEMACVRCHGLEGEGHPQDPIHGAVPKLGDPTRGGKWDVDSLEKVIRDGRGGMPPHRARLEGADIRTVAQYVHGRFFSAGGR